MLAADSCKEQQPKIKKPHGGGAKHTNQTKRLKVKGESVPDSVRDGSEMKLATVVFKSSMIRKSYVTD